MPQTAQHVREEARGLIGTAGLDCVVDGLFHEIEGGRSVRQVFAGSPNKAHKLLADDVVPIALIPRRAEPTEVITHRRMDTERVTHFAQHQMVSHQSVEELRNLTAVQRSQRSGQDPFALQCSTEFAHALQGSMFKSQVPQATTNAPERFEPVQRIEVLRGSPVRLAAVSEALECEFEGGRGAAGLLSKGPL
jgi:hypothetical protein